MPPHGDKSGGRADDTDEASEQRKPELRDPQRLYFETTGFFFVNEFAKISPAAKRKPKVLVIPGVPHFSFFEGRKSDVEFLRLLPYGLVLKSTEPLVNTEAREIAFRRNHFRPFAVVRLQRGSRFPVGLCDDFPPFTVQPPHFEHNGADTILKAQWPGSERVGM
jgi:hypothetical protein